MTGSGIGPGVEGAAHHGEGTPKDAPGVLHPAVADLLDLLALERLDRRLFRGRNEAVGGERLFGGQVLGQALRAAALTVTERRPHSLHGYFLRPGRHDHPVIYDVDLLRDGRTFTTRRVVALQHGEAIFSMTVSFQAPPRASPEEDPAPGPGAADVEDPIEYAEDPPAWPGPELLRDDAAIARERQGEDPNVMPWQVRERPFEVRSVYPFGTVPDAGPVKPAWLRLRGPAPEDPVLHACLLAYASDMGLMSTALVPHLERTSRRDIVGASLDHAIWFHDDPRVDDWLLHDRDCPVTGSGRGFNRGRIWDLRGRHVATMTQEALLRRVRRPA